MNLRYLERNGEKVLQIVATSSGEWEDVPIVKTLNILERIEKVLHSYRDKHKERPPCIGLGAEDLKQLLAMKSSRNEAINTGELSCFGISIVMVQTMSGIFIQGEN